MESLQDFSAFVPYLDSDEMVLWRGEPGRVRVLGGQDLFLVAFGLFWLGFSLFWEFMVFQAGNQPVMLVFGLPFIAVGLYLVFGRLIQRVRLRGQVQYMVTSKKLLVRSGADMQLYDGQDLPPMHIRMHRDGTGSILFYQEVYTGRGRRMGYLCTLDHLADADRAQSALRRMMENTRR